MTKNYYLAAVFLAFGLGLLVLVLLGPAPSLPPKANLSPSALERPRIVTSPATEPMPTTAPPEKARSEPAKPQATPVIADKVALLDAMSEAAHTFSPDALPFLAQQLESNDPEVREFALECIKILSEPGGVAVLRQAALKARTPRDKADLLEAAEWLGLPEWKPRQTGQ